MALITPRHQLATRSSCGFMVTGGCSVLKHLLTSARDPLEGRGGFMLFSFSSSPCPPAHLHPRAPRRVSTWSGQRCVRQGTGAPAYALLGGGGRLASGKVSCIRWVSAGAVVSCFAAVCAHLFLLPRFSSSRRTNVPFYLYLIRRCFNVSSTNLCTKCKNCFAYSCLGTISHSRSGFVPLFCHLYPSPGMQTSDAQILRLCVWSEIFTHSSRGGKKRRGSWRSCAVRQV